MHEYTVLSSLWWTPPTPVELSAYGQPIVGCVAILSLEAKPRQWKCYIGVADGQYPQKNCEQYIARQGMPIGNKEAACAFFPFLSPKGFRS